METLLVGAALLLGGAAALWASWLMSQRRLAPNAVVGVRLPVTRRSDAAWYAAHEAAAGPLGVGGALAATGGVGVVFTGLDTIGVALALLAVAALTTATGVATWAAVRAARAA